MSQKKKKNPASWSRVLEFLFFLVLVNLDLIVNLRRTGRRSRCVGIFAFFWTVYIKKKVYFK